MDSIWECWAEFEKSLPIIGTHLIKAGQKANSRGKRMYVWLLDELIEKRRDMRRRCRSPAYSALPEDERPLELPDAGVEFLIGDVRGSLK